MSSLSTFLVTCSFILRDCTDFVPTLYHCTLKKNRTTKKRRSGSKKETRKVEGNMTCPADLANSLNPDEDCKSDHTTLVQVKENEEVATLTVTIERKLPAGRPRDQCGLPFR